MEADLFVPATPIRHTIASTDNFFPDPQVNTNYLESEATWIGENTSFHIY